MLFLVFCLGFLWRNRHSQVVSGQEQILGAEVVVVEDFKGKGQVIFDGEQWTATCSQPVHKDEIVKVTAIKGLVLTVNPVEVKE